MKPKHQRLITVLGMLLLMGIGAVAILSSFRQQLIYFYTPSQLHEAMGNGQFQLGRDIRVGGLVKEGSVYHTQAGKTGFIITDLNQEIHASYTGLLPGLFREGQGVVAQGKIDDKGALVASTILAKHDERYMPKEVVDALKKSGRWQVYAHGRDAPGGETAPATASPRSPSAPARRSPRLRTDTSNATPAP